MAEILKSDLVAGAYSRARISGLTVSPSAEENTLALGLLDAMMAEWFAQGYCVGYKIPGADDTSDLGDPSGIELRHKYAIETCLAGRIMVDFGKVVPMDLRMTMNASFSALASSIAVMEQTQYPNRMPRGNGSTIKLNSWRRYFRKAEEAPISCETNYMIIGEINSYQEDFTAYLDDGETVSSFTIISDTGITVLSSALNTANTIVTYSIEAVGTSENISPYLRLKITATTSAGRKEIRIVDFQLESESVGD